MEPQYRMSMIAEVSSLAQVSEAEWDNLDGTQGRDYYCIVGGMLRGACRTSSSPRLPTHSGSSRVDGRHGDADLAGQRRIRRFVVYEPEGIVGVHRAAADQRGSDAPRTRYDAVRTTSPRLPQPMGNRRPQLYKETRRRTR